MSTGNYLLLLLLLWPDVDELLPLPPRLDELLPPLRPPPDLLPVLLLLPLLPWEVLPPLAAILLLVSGSMDANPRPDEEELLLPELERVPELPLPELSLEPLLPEVPILEEEEDPLPEDDELIPALPELVLPELPRLLPPERWEDDPLIPDDDPRLPLCLSSS